MDQRLHRSQENRPLSHGGSAAPRWNFGAACRCSHVAAGPAARHRRYVRPHRGGCSFARTGGRRCPPRATGPAGRRGFAPADCLREYSNLLLARGSARTAELAVRLALGASRKRVIEQMLAESLLLSCAGGVVGLGLAVLATGFLGQLIPPGISEGGAPSVNGPLLIFAAGVSIATGILFGTLPAWRGAKVELVTSLKQGGGRSGVGAGGQRVRGVLVVTEVALAIVLLTGATLMIRSFGKLYHQDPGFRAEHVLTLLTRLQYPKYQSMARRSEFYREVLQRVETLPGVVAAGYTTYLPLAD